MDILKTFSLALLIAGCGILSACSSDAPNPTPQSPVPATVESSPSPIPTIPSQQNVPANAALTASLVLSAARDGRWDLFGVSPGSGGWQRLTGDGSSQAPAISRDGKRIAFQSHRDGNWEIYAMGADGSQVARLTRSLAFDGQPNWSPDGTQIAFASTRQDDLDIWLMNADGTNPRDLTENTPAVDDTPAWSPDGRWIAFTSLRTGSAQIFIISTDGKQTIDLSQNKFDDQLPAWSPDGKQIAFVSDRDGARAIYVADFSAAGLKNPQRLTFSGWDDMPAWSPDGQSIAFVSPRPAREAVYVVSVKGGLARIVDDKSMHVRSVAWANVGTPFVANGASDPPAPLLYPQPPAVNAAALIPMKDVYLAPSYGEMSNRVAGSYQALRAQVKAQTGWDFLGVLSDMTRQLSGGVCGDGCENLSWHKTGRAVDTRLAVVTAGVQMIEIVREDQLGETYWRVYVRVAKQDGTLGAPLTEAPWDWTNYARWTLAPHAGGVPKTIPVGYYVDFTELAHAYGWERISSYDDPTLSWKENNTGMEFWHFQKTDGLNWYAAVSELHSRQTLAVAFDWNTLLRQKTDPYLLALKGLPAPPSAWRWFGLFP